MLCWDMLFMLTPTHHTYHQSPYWEEPFTYWGLNQDPSDSWCNPLSHLGTLPWIVIVTNNLCIDDGIDWKSFCKRSFLIIYFWLINYFVANLSINKREAIYFLIKTMYVIAFILKSMGPRYTINSLSDILRYGWNYLVIAFFL